jgi:hypothetical protein
MTTTVQLLFGTPIFDKTLGGSLADVCEQKIVGKRLLDEIYRMDIVSHLQT